MNCNNCGARIRDGAKICPVCGALLDDESNYTLLASDDRYDDIYSSEAPKRRHGGLKAFLIILLVAALAGGGAYYYFTHIRPQKAEAPQVTFTDGSGIINRDQKVIYVTLGNKDIEFIHGVSLYEGDITAVEDKKAIPEPVSTAYEYTKNVDTTFRAIFFDTAELNLQKDKEYTYTFMMYFSFIGSDEIYPYLKAVTFGGDIKDDAADIIFDHSMTEDTAKKETTAQATTETTTTEKAKTGSADFLYEGYWYTEPSTEGEQRSIAAFKFGKDKVYKITHYDKKGSDDWVIYSEEGKYDISGDTILLDDGTQFIFDSEKESVFEESDGKKTHTFTHRKYNSTQNAEDFFGI